MDTTLNQLGIVYLEPYNAIQGGVTTRSVNRESIRKFSHAQECFFHDIPQGTEDKNKFR